MSQSAGPPVGGLVLRSYGSIEQIPAADWDALVGAQGSPFLEHAWLLALEQTQCASALTGWHPQHITAWTGERLVAAAPVYIKTHSMGEFVYDWSWARAAQQLGVDYYPKLVVGVPFTPVSGQRLLVAQGLERGPYVRALTGALLELGRQAKCAGLHVLFNEEQEAQELEQLGARSRLQFQFHWKNRGYSDFEDFLSGFRSKRRTEFRRERRRLAERGLRIERLAGSEIEQRDLHAMAGFYRNTCGLFGGNAYLNQDLWRSLRERFGQRLQLVMAWEGATPIAGALNVQKAGRLYGRYWGCSKELPYLHFEVCYYQAIEHCIEHGLQVFEPGHGGGHKYPRGFEPTLTWSSHWLSEPRLDGPVRDFLRRERAQVREQVAHLRASSTLRFVSDRPSGPAK